MRRPFLRDGPASIWPDRKRAVNETTFSLQERVRILKKLRNTLLDQRTKLSEYLNLLEKEEESILEGDFEGLEQKVHLEGAIMGDIVRLQQAISPLEDLYTRAFPESEASIPSLRSTLERMKHKVAAKNEANRTLLKKKMETLRQEIKTLRQGYRFISASRRIQTPSLVDMST